MDVATQQPDELVRLVARRLGDSLVVVSSLMFLIGRKLGVKLARGHMWTYWEGDTQLVQRGLLRYET